MNVNVGTTPKFNINTLGTEWSPIGKALAGNPGPAEQVADNETAQDQVNGELVTQNHLFGKDVSTFQTLQEAEQAARKDAGYFDSGDPYAIIQTKSGYQAVHLDYTSVNSNTTWNANVVEFEDQATNGKWQANSNYSGQ